MSSVDERVVSMKFDNAQFEDGVKTTLETLNKLKSSLDENTSASYFDGISRAANNVQLTGISEAVDSLSNRFSAMGIVGMTVLQSITNSILSAGSSLMTNLINPITSGGWNRASNIEKAEFQITGLGKDWQALHDDMEYAVNDTAYGLDEAAMAAGQLSASGVNAGDNMKTALRGISGLAAMTGSSYTDIANIFTTVAGNGRLMSEQLLQVSSRGINAASELAKYLGTDEATVRDMVSKGKIDFATFAAAMDNAFGEHAKEANKTFTGAMSNVHAAMSKIGADFEGVMISSDDYGKYLTSNSTQYANLISMANAYRQALNGLRTALKPVAADFANVFHGIADVVTKALTSLIDQDVLSSSKVYKFIAPVQEAFTNIYNGLKNISDFILSVAGTIGQAWESIFPPVTFQTIADITSGFEKLTEMLPKVSDVGKLLSDTFGIDITGAFDSVATAAENVQEAYNGVTGSLQDLVAAVINGDYGNGQDRIEALGESYQQIQDAVNSCYEGTTLYEDRISSISGTVGPVIDQTETAAQAIATVSDETKKGSDTIQQTISTFDNVRETFQGVFAAVDMLKKIAQYVVKFAQTFLVPIISGVIEIGLSFSGMIGSWIKYLDTLIPSLSQAGDFIDNLAIVLKPLTDILSTVKDFIVDLFNSLRPGQDVIGNLISWVGKARDAFTDFLSSIKLPFGGDLLSVITGMFEPVQNFVSSSFPSLTKSFESIGNCISDFIKSIDIPGNPFGTIVNGLGALKDKVSEVFKLITSSNGSSIFEALLSIFNFIKSVFGGIFAFLDPILSGIITEISNFVSRFVDSLKISGDPLKAISDSIGGFVSDISSYFSNIELPNGKNLLEDITSIFGPALKFLENIAGLFGAVLSSIVDFFSDFGKGIADNVSTISDPLGKVYYIIKTALSSIGGLISGASLPDFKSILANVGNFFTPLTKMIEDFGKVLDTFFNYLFKPTIAKAETLTDDNATTIEKNVKTPLTSLSDFLSSIASSITNSLKVLSDGIDSFETFVENQIDRVSRILGKIAGVYIAFETGNLLKNASGLLNNLGNLTKSLKNLADGLKFFNVSKLLGIDGALKAFQKKLNAERIKDIAIAIAILAGSIAILSMVPQEKLWGAVAAIAAGAAVLIATSKLLSKVDSSSLQSIGIGMLALAGGVGILVLAVKALGKMDFGVLIQGILSVAGLLITLGAAFAIANLGAKDSKKSAGLIIGMALAILILTRAVKIFGSMDENVLKQGAIAVGVALGVIAGAIAIINLSSRGATKSSGLIMGLALSLYMIAGAIAVFASMDLAAMSGAIFIVVAALAGISFAVVQINKSARGSEKSGGTILALAASLIILAAAVEIFGSMPFDTLEQGINAVTLALGVFTICLVAINKTSKSSKDSAKNILSMTAAIAVMAIAIAALSVIPYDNLSNSVQALCDALITFSVAIAIVNETSKKSKNAIPAIIAMGVAMAALAAAIYFLAQMPVDNVSASAESLSLALLTFAATFAIIAEVSKKMNGMGLAGILTMVVAVGVLGAALYFLAQCDPERVGAAAESMSLSLLTFAAAMLIISSAGIKSLGAVAGILAMSVAVGVIAASLYALSQLNPDSLTASLGALCIALLVFTAALAVLSGIGPEVALASIGILAMSVAIVAIAGALYVLSQIDADSLANALGALTIALIEFVAAAVVLSIVGLVAEAGAVGLLALGAACLMIGAGVYLAASGITMLIDAIGRLAQVLADIAAGAVQMGADIVQGLWNGITGAFSAIGNFAQMVFDSIVGGVKSLFGIASPSTVMSDLGGFMIQGLASGLGNRMGSLAGVAGQIGTTILGAIQSIPGKLAELGQNAMNAIGGAFTSFAQDPIGSITNVGKGVVDGINGFVGKVSEVGHSFMESFDSAIKANQQTAKDDAVAISDSTASGFEESEGVVSDAAKNNADAAGTGVAQSTAYQQAIQQMIDNGTITAEQGQVMMENAGKTNADAAGSGASSSTAFVDAILEQVSNGSMSMTDAESLFSSNGLTLANCTGDGVDGSTAFNDAILTKLQNGEITLDEAKAAYHDAGVGLEQSGGSGIASSTSMDDETKQKLQETIDTIKDTNPKMAATLQGLLSGDAASSAGSEGGTTAGNSLLSSFSGTLSNANVSDILGGLGSKITEGLGTDITSNLGNLDGSMSGITDKISSSLNDTSNSESVSTSAQNIDNSIATGITNGQQVVTDAVNNLGTTAAQGIDPTAFTGVGDQVTSYIANGITSGSTAINDSVGNISTGISTTLSTTLSPDTFVGEGQAISSSIGVGIASGAEAVTDEASAVGSTIYDSISGSVTSQDYGSIGASIGNSLADGLAGSYSYVRSSASALNSSVADGLSTLPNSMNEIAVSATDTFASGLSNGARSVGDAARGVMDAAASSASSAADGFSSVGDYCDQGLINGLYGGLGNVEIAAYAVGKAALDAAKNAVDSNSPSKKFMELGMYNDQGLAIGMEKYSNVVEDASSDVASSTLSAMGDIGSRLSDVINSNIDSSPIITPVLDLSEIQNGSGLIGNMLSAQSVSADYAYGQVQSIYSDLSSRQLQQESNARAMSDMVDKLDGIGSRISALESNLPGYISDNAPSLVLDSEGTYPLVKENLTKLQILNKM